MKLMIKSKAALVAVTLISTSAAMAAEDDMATKMVSR
jgi:hypothetical protein